MASLLATHATATATIRRGVGVGFTLILFYYFILGASLTLGARRFAPRNLYYFIIYWYFFYFLFFIFILYNYFLYVRPKIRFQFFLASLLPRRATATIRRGVGVGFTYHWGLATLGSRRFAPPTQVA